MPFHEKPDVDLFSSFPLLSDTKVTAGFPSPAEQYAHAPLDLNSLMVRHPAGTYFVRVEGDSMRDAGIFENDILVVDRTRSPNDGEIVIAAIESEFTVKYFKRNGSQVYLQAANPAYPNIECPPNGTLEIFGVVTGVVRQLLK